MNLCKKKRWKRVDITLGTFKNTLIVFLLNHKEKTCIFATICLSTSEHMPHCETFWNNCLFYNVITHLSHDI